MKLFAKRCKFGRKLPDQAGWRGRYVVKGEMMEQTRENKMGSMPLGKLIITMSLPIMISMLVQALYNVVDSIFVARISENALTAVSMAFPIQNLMIAIGSGTAVGVNALLSRALGAKQFERVNKIAENAVLLTIVSYILFLLIGIFGARTFFAVQTDIGEIVECGTSYLTICCCLSMGIFFQLMFERLLQSTGKTFYTMITQGTGAIINIILDPILIFGMFGMPKMGVAGAAAATVAGQTVAGIMAIWLNHKKNVEVNIQMKGFRPDGGLILEIYKIGIPSVIMMAIGSVMTFGMNQILLGFSATATAVFGVYFKLQSFIFMPVFGLNNGIIPVIAYNYGAGNRKRVTGSVKLGLCYAVVIMVCGLILFQTLPEQLLLLFDASENMLAIGVPALRIISIHFPLAAFGIACGSVFQALGNATYSMIISIVRQLVALLPAAWLLALAGNVSLVWWAFPISECVSAVMTAVFLIRINRKIISGI